MVIQMTWHNEMTAEESMLLDYMDDVKERALTKLTPLEIAALFNDFAEFRFEYWKESEDQFNANLP